MRARLSMLLLALAMTSCSAGDTRVDAASENDARTTSDSGAMIDAATADAGQDATIDAGANVDASASVDASVSIDASTHDASAIDAATRDTGPVIAPCSGTEIFTVTFQSGTMPTNVTREQPMQSTTADPRLAVVAAPWSASHYALRAIVRAGDDSGSGYPRSEITPAITPHMAFGEHYCFRGGYWFPGDSTFPRPTSTRAGLMVAPLQLHARDGISPILALQLLENGAQLAYQPGDNATSVVTTLGAIPVNRYVSFQLDYVGSTSTDGYVRLVLDGTVAFEHSGANHVGPRTTNPDAGFFKMGLYDFWSTVPTELTVYVDDLHVFHM